MKCRSIWRNAKCVRTDVAFRGATRLNAARGKKQVWRPMFEPLRSFASKCTALKKVLVTLLGLRGPREIVHLVPPSLRPWWYSASLKKRTITTHIDISSPKRKTWSRGKMRDPPHSDRGLDRKRICGARFVVNKEPDVRFSQMNASWRHLVLVFRWRHLRCTKKA